MSTKLPNDQIAERALLGCLLADGSAFDEISDIDLSPEDFYSPRHATLYEVMKDLFEGDEPVDYITVVGRLTTAGKLEEIGGQQEIYTIGEEQASAVNIVHYAKTIKEKSVVRRVIKTAGKVIDRAQGYDGKTEDFLSEVEHHFFTLTNETKKGGLQNLKRYLRENLKELETDSRKPGEIAGLPTGFTELDKKLLGMQPGQLIVLAARPAMGKTSLALNMAINTCKFSKLPIAIFSLEMLAGELSRRIISFESGIDGRRLQVKNFLDSDLHNLARAVKDLSQLPIYINDSADIKLADIRSQCRKIKLEQGLGLIVIDYLQLMNSSSNNLSREQQISEISRGLKNLAKELECPLISLSQLNRAVESRTDKRPMVSDLRESGSIEQDADIVLLIYRDEVYNPNTNEKGIAEIIVGKNRAGETGTAKLAWIGSQTKFGNLSFSPDE